MDRSLFPVFRTATPYLAAFTISLALGSYLNYVDNLYSVTLLEFKGQPLGILVPLMGFLVSFSMWIFTKSTVSSSEPTVAFLAALILAWVGHFIVLILHDNSTFHTIWVCIPVLIMVGIKPPSISQLKYLLASLFWTLAIAIVLTYFLELLNLLPVYFIPEEVRLFESGKYWIPLDGFLGFEGRWSGPFGYNSKTGFVGALLVIYSLGNFKLRNVPILVIGATTLLATDSRGAYIALIMGIITLMVFTEKGPLANISRRVRIIVAGSGAAGTVLTFWVLNPNLTGRFGEGGIWAAYVELFQTSPIIGVSRYAMSIEPGLVSKSMGAHNGYLEFLVSTGWVGLILILIPLFISLVYSVRYALSANAWPLALLVVYLFMNVTEVIDTSWLSFSIYTWMILLVTLISTQRDTSKIPF